MEERAAGADARWRLAVVAACAAVALAAFAPVLTNGFVEIFDDALFVTRNGWVRLGLSWEGLRWAFRGDGATYWHPLTWLSLMADVQLFGVRPGPIHAVNLALHVLTAALLFLALNRMTARFWRSAAVALLFVVHPIQVEAVAWAVERKTLLASAIGMGAILAYSWYAARPAAGRYLVVFSLFTLSTLAKPLFVTLPFLLLLLDVWPLGRTSLAPAETGGGGFQPATWPRLALEKLPFLAVALAVVALVSRSFTALAEEVPPSLRAANALTSSWVYLGKLAWPSRLAIYYPNPGHIPAWETGAAAAGLAIASLLLLALRRRSPGAALGWFWFLGTLVPVSGIMRNGLWPAMADRFMYLPMIGVVIGVVWWIAGLAEGRSRLRVPLGAAFAVALAAFSARTHAQALVWRDSVTLFRNAVAVTPPSRFVWSNYGNALEAAGRHEEARAWWQEMIRVIPGAADGYVNLGTMLHRSGDLRSAEALYLAALAVEPGSGQARYDLAILQKGRGDLEGALAGFSAAKAAGLRDAPVLEQIGEVSAALGRVGEAEAAYREAVRAQPLNWRATAALAQLRAARGGTVEAQALLGEAWVRAGLAGEAEEARRIGLGPR